MAITTGRPGGSGPPVSRFLVGRTFFIVGPTATGKSELAAEVALRCGAEVVSADAFQLYRGMPLLTAQPEANLRSKVPHHLINVVPADEEMSAAKFLDMACRVLDDIHGRGRAAIVVGGSGLYLKALTHGLMPSPPVDEKLRSELQDLSLVELNQRLAALDPIAAEKIDKQNKRRVARALEICLQTGRPASAQRTGWQSEFQRPAGVLVFCERAELARRIECRIEQMFRRGVVKEVRTLGALSSTATKALGRDAIAQLLAGKMNEEECIAAIAQATRRYAKRQLTWFRRESNFEPLNLSRLKDHQAAIDWIVQRARSAFTRLDD